MRAPATCTIPGCGKPFRARGMCASHYGRWQRHGDPRIQKGASPTATLMERMLLHSERQPNGCLVWRGRLSRDGYGQVGVNGKTRDAHKVMYRLVKGRYPYHLELDHLCRVRACIEPDHLEPVTHTVNVQRGFDARRAEAAI